MDDNAIARRHHEQSARHRGSVQRQLDEQHRKNRQVGDKAVDVSRRVEERKPERQVHEQEPKKVRENVIETAIGQWEEVVPRPQLARKLGSPLRDPEEERAKAFGSIDADETPWEAASKTIDDDSDEPQTQPSRPTFKKRKVKP